MMTEIESRTLHTLRSGLVERWHALPDVARQNDAAHAWGVTVLALGLCEDLYSPEELSALVRAALLHDTAEMWTGDIPRETKHKVKSLRDVVVALESYIAERYLLQSPKLSDEQSKVLSACDLLEAYIHAKRTHRHWESVAAEWDAAIDAACRDTPVIFAARVIRITKSDLFN